MPTYTYRREDGTTFEIRQKFLDDPLDVDPETGQKVTRVIHSAGVIFKGSGFYVTDNRNASNPAAPKASSNGNGSDTSATPSSNGSSNGASADTGASSTTSTSSTVSAPAAD